MSSQPTARPIPNANAHQWLDDRRLAGAAGVLFFGWLVVAIVTIDVILGAPSFADSAATYREYYTQNATVLLIVTWVGFGCWVFGFLGFATGLRGVLTAGDQDAVLWPSLMVVGATLVVAIGGSGGVFEAVLAAGIVDKASDDLLLALAQMQEIADTMILPWALTLFIVAAAVSIARSGVLGRGLTWLGLACAALLVTGALWPLTGEDQGVVATIGLLGLTLVGVWVLIASVRLLRGTGEPSGPS
jgi:hypothetical protein